MWVSDTRVRSWSTAHTWVVQSPVEPTAVAPLAGVAADEPRSATDRPAAARGAGRRAGSPRRPPARRPSRPARSTARRSAPDRRASGAGPRRRGGGPRRGDAPRARAALGPRRRLRSKHSRTFSISSAVTQPVAPGIPRSVTPAVVAQRAARSPGRGSAPRSARSRMPPPRRISASIASAELPAVEDARAFLADQLEAPGERRVANAVAGPEVLRARAATGRRAGRSGRPPGNRASSSAYIAVTPREIPVDRHSRGARAAPPGPPRRGGPGSPTARARGPGRPPSPAPRRRDGRARSRRLPRRATGRGRRSARAASRYIRACARRGASTLKSSATDAPARGRWISIEPPPARQDMNGSTTAIANAVATAASTAFPPRRRMSAPTRAPRGWPAVTQARATSSWLFVTERREAFTTRSFSHGPRDALPARGPRRPLRTGPGEPRARRGPRSRRTRGA